MRWMVAAYASWACCICQSVMWPIGVQVLDLAHRVGQLGGAGHGGAGQVAQQVAVAFFVGSGHGVRMRQKRCRGLWGDAPTGK